MNEIYYFSAGTHKCTLERLAFLGRFLHETVQLESLADLGKIMGVTRQAVFMMMKKDDMTLKRLISIFEHYGYDLKFHISTPMDNLNRKDDNNKGKLVRVHTFADDHQASKNLGFLSQAIVRSQLSIRQISNRTGVANATIKNRIANDDCPYSFLLLLLKKLDWTMDITYKKKKA